MPPKLPLLLRGGARRAGWSNFPLLAMVKNELLQIPENNVKIVHNIPICCSKHFQSQIRQEVFSFFVIFKLVVMRPAVNFNDNLQFSDIKINDEIADYKLSCKVDTIDFFLFTCIQNTVSARLYPFRFWRAKCTNSLLRGNIIAFFSNNLKPSIIIIVEMKTTK